MKTNLLINLWIFTVLFTSCHITEKYENASLFTFKDFKTVIKLNAATIEFDEEIMRPLSFVKSDSLLIVQNIMTRNMLYVYNVNSKKKIGEFISFGNGPNELLRIKNMQLVGRDLYISDTQKKSVNKYDVNDFYAFTEDLIPKQKVAIEDFFYNLVYTENGYVVIAMNTDNKRLVFYNSKGEREFTAGEYPYFGRDLTVIEKAEGFISSIAVCQKNKHIYLFGMTTDLIEIYDFNGMLLKRLHGPDQLFPQVKEIRSEDGFSKVSAIEKSRFTYNRPLIVDDEIYVSYSGNHQTRDEGTPRIHHILVFDLDCNPIRRYELPKSIVAFTVDSDAKLIFATSDEPEFHMVILE
jgi:hypothetical protein